MNFPKDTKLLSLKDKLNRLHNLTTLNQQTKINTVHISLNFDLSDKLNEAKLKVIAETYMQKIGFGEQPYLVYQHHDAGRSHLHIVTTNIKSDGRRIELHNLGRNLSMRASKEIEKEFSLVEALSKSRIKHELKPVNIQKAQYGKSETKREITKVLDAVLPNYKYTSLAELNAVLQLYNVVADRGSETSRIYQCKGLVYRILNEKGEKVGVPIKASLIYNKPTLKTIEAGFAQNEIDRQRHKQRVRNAADLSLLNRQPSINNLQQTLSKQQIQLIFRQNNNGVVYGLTYVDHQTKCVFNGSDLGKQYSANAIQQRCSQESISNTQLKQTIQSVRHMQNEPDSVAVSSNSLSDILHDLAISKARSVAYELLQDKKRKRKKNNISNLKKENIMSMNTGENEQGLRKVIDLTRMISIILLLLHYYYYCYAAFQQWNLTTPIGDRILKNLSQTGLFNSFNTSKGITVAFLLLSLIGVRGKKKRNNKIENRISLFSGWRYFLFR